MPIQASDSEFSIPFFLEHHDTHLLPDMAGRLATPGSGNEILVYVPREPPGGEGQGTGEACP